MLVQWDRIPQNWLSTLRSVQVKLTIIAACWDTYFLLNHVTWNSNLFVQGIEGVSKIKDGYNPATWMLEVSSSAQEEMLGVDFCEIYKQSELYQ